MSTDQTVRRTYREQAEIIRPTRQLATYDHSIPLRALNHQTHIQALKSWRKTDPDLFAENVHEHAGLDMQARPSLRK